VHSGGDILYNTTNALVAAASRKNGGGNKNTFVKIKLINIFCCLGRCAEMQKEEQLQENYILSTGSTVLPGARFGKN
jgi:hypothetical protein